MCESVCLRCYSYLEQYLLYGQTYFCCIKVKVDLAGINIRVQVIDNGFGIESKHLENIFDRFYRVKNEKTRYITGTGLGLPIVKELVSSLGGMVDVDSTPGQGSVFTVLLPTQGQ